jgi:glycosyltransferase involved in cell wall biosynthesis
LVVCTDLYTLTGGVQRFNQLIPYALDLVCQDDGKKNPIVSLRDSSNRITSPQGGSLNGEKVFGSEGSKIRFIISIIKLVLVLKPSIILLTHINLAPISIILRVISPNSKAWLVLHGFEAWEKIPLLNYLGITCCAGFLSVSDYTKREFCERNKISQERVFVIYLTTGHEWDDTIVRPELCPVKYSCILCVSRLEPAHAYYKGVDKIIRAIAALARSGRLGGFHLVIVGEGDDQKRLVELAEQEGIAHLVHFTGRISDIELKAYYAHCEMFVLPSTKEGFGLVYLEAMSFSKPVIASQEGASKEIVVDGLTGYLVPDGDIGALAGKISLLIDSKDERERLGKAGRDRYLENFTFSKFVERLKTALLE